MTDQTVSLLQLVKRKDADNTDVNAVDFLALPTELQYQGWNQGLPQPNQPSVDESITLLMNAGNANTLATALQSIDTKIKEIGWAQDPLNPIGVWLRAQLTGETNPRQCFILAAKRPPKGLEITNPLAYSNIVPNYNLGLTRMPAWEDTTVSSLGGTDISAHGGTVSCNISGDAHARIGTLHVEATYPGSFNEVWFGVKSSRYGVNPANFIPVWPLTNTSSYTTPDSTNSNDATALNGKKKVCTFATVTTMDYRAVIILSTITAFNQDDQRGKYLALLRAKTTDASLVCNVRVGNGYLVSGSVNSFAFQPRYRISVANTGWRYYTLGQVKIPATVGFFDQPFDHCALAVQAEKISGSGNLEMDSLLLIPAEHCIHASCTSSPAIDSFRSLYLTTRPDDKYYGILIDGNQNSVIEAPLPDQITWSIPSGNGVIVCVASSSNSLVADQIKPSFSVYSSYNSLRGSA